MTPITVLGISGSLRRRSYNTAALRAARELAPQGVTVMIADLSAIPPYNDDVREREGYPAAVEHLRNQVRAADAVLFATPEYNYSIPGVLKNAIDWVSRPPDQPFAGKAAAIIGASPGPTGTARAQYHLRQIGVYLDLHFLNKPEVMIANAGERFDQEGLLKDEKTAELLRKLLENLHRWSLKLMA